MCPKGKSVCIITLLMIGGLSLPACALTQEQILPTETPMNAMTVIQDTQPRATEVAQVATLELPTAEPTLSPTATALVIEQQTIKDEGDDPKYTVAVNYPVIDGMDVFNLASQAIAESVTNAFMENLATFPPVNDPNLMSYSIVSMDFTVLDKTPEVISVYFQLSEYYSGAAHPLPFSTVLNYDVRNQQVLVLSDLFHPGADYLQLISDYATNELIGEEWFTFTDGMLPKAENYRNWNLTPDGLQITFDPYQVAPYAAGFITVLVPFVEFIGIANPDGVLARN